MKRWLLVLIALVLVVGAGYALLTAGESSPRVGAHPSPKSPSTPVAGSPDDIGDESREALREILREADREESH